MTLHERAQQLAARQPEVQAILRQAVSDATTRAMELAADLTPPTADDLAGTNMRSGQMKQHWATDSVTTPMGEGIHLATVLANNMQYASYVNDGHSLYRHFVPGLKIENGMLMRETSGEGGLMVGTKTQWVEGLHMKEAAVEEYRRVLKVELKKKLPEVLR